MQNEYLPEKASRELVSIGGLHVEPEIQGAWANAWIWVEVDNHTLEPKQVLATIMVKLGENQEKIEVVEMIEPQGGMIEAVIRIEEPELWWPHGFGNQTLYTCLAGLSVEGDIQDVAQQRFGVRSIELLGGNEPTAIIINGEEIALEEGVWAPRDQFVEHATGERYTKLVREAIEADTQLIRAWGEGDENDTPFYDTCDEQGLMVWQELAVGTASSASDELAELVGEHISQRVANLRNHPSIIAWCGSSESEDVASGKLLGQIIPKLLEEMDRTRTYTSKCPLSENR